MGMRMRRTGKRRKTIIDCDKRWFQNPPPILLCLPAAPPKGHSRFSSPAAVFLPLPSTFSIVSFNLSESSLLSSSGPSLDELVAVDEKKGGRLSKWAISIVSLTSDKFAVVTARRRGHAATAASSSCMGYII